MATGGGCAVAAPAKLDGATELPSSSDVSVAGVTTTGFSCSVGSCSNIPDPSPEPEASSPAISLFFVFDDAACPLSHSPSPEEGVAPLSENDR